MAQLPVYEMLISNDPASDLEVSAIALVDEPAIQKNWISFKENVSPLHFADINDEAQMVIGAAMIPDMLIYRNDPKLGEYNCFFSKATVVQCAEKFYSKNFQGKANIMHDPAQTVTGVNYFLSWIKDSAKGMVGLAGEYPEGTWFVGARVSDPGTWAKVKSGDIKGFSVEGMFEYAKEAEPEEAANQLLAKIKSLLNEINA